MKINNKNVPWMFGETILDAANKVGIFIPSLCCDASFLNNESSCRLCLVHVTNGGKTYIAPACSTETEAEMEIVTDSKELKSIRSTILQLIYAEAPDNKTVLDMMEKCNVKPDPEIPLKGGRDCILCGRCVNACNTWVKGAIARMGRGVNMEINTPFSEATDECLGCGSCELICPLDSIESTDSDKHRRIWNNEFELLHCKECGKLLTTVENYEDAFYPDAPTLCNECSEEYRKKYRSNGELYCY